MHYSELTPNNEEEHAMSHIKTFITKNAEAIAKAAVCTAIASSLISG